MRARGRWAARAVVLAAIFAGGPLAALLGVPEASAYTPRAPIFIDGNADFTAANGVTGGTGTPADPFRIEGWEINASSADGIDIRNTRAHFVIRDVLVHSGVRYYWPPHYHEGVLLTNVSNGRVEGADFVDVFNGVRLVSSEDVEVRDSNVSAEGQGYGVFVHRSRRVTVAGNRLSMAGGTGIGVGASDNITAAGNEIDSSRSGVEFLYSSDVSARANTIRNAIGGLALDHTVRGDVSGNAFASAGVRIRGEALGQFNSHSIADDNLVNGRPLRYHRDCAGLTLDGVPTGQLLVVNCADVQVSNLWINDTDYAVELAFVGRATITDSILSNSSAGASVFYSSNVTIVGNTFWKNRDGLGFTDVVDARVHGNSFIINGAWELGGARNAWDTGYPAGGNYWTQYEGTDRCSGASQDVCPDPDGIGDTPLPVPVKGSDRYPLFGPGLGNASELRVVVTTDKSAYAVGEPVTITMVVENPTARPITLHFSSSCHHAYRVEDPDEQIRFMPEIVCLAVQTSYTLLAGERTDGTQWTWNQSDDAGDQVPPGEYIIRGFTLSYEDVPPGFARITIGDAPVTRPGDGPAAGASAAPLWTAGAVAAIGVVAAGALVFRWARTRRSR